MSNEYMNHTPMTGDEGHRSGLDHDELEWCHDRVQEVSRTFALTVNALEEPMATQVCLGYLICRIPDTIEDAGHLAMADKAVLLRTYGRAIDPNDDTRIETFVAKAAPQRPPGAERSAEWRVVGEADRIHATFRGLPVGSREAIIPPVLELVEGMATFVDRHADAGGIRIESSEELERYCYYAAGTVGHLVTNLLTSHGVSPTQRRILYDNAEGFGLLLQLVNIAKDVYADFTYENNVYLPASWLRDADVPQEHVIHPDYQAATATVVARTASRAEAYLDDAQRYLSVMPLCVGNTVAAWTVPFLLAVATLRELSKRPEDALTDQGVKVSRREVHAVLDATSRADRTAIGALRSSIEHEPFHVEKGPIE